MFKHQLTSLIVGILDIAHAETETNNCAEKICFPESYNKFIPPEERLSIYVDVFTGYGPSQLTEVDDFRSMLKLNIALSILWKDNRVMFNDNSSLFYIESNTGNKFWKSGLYIQELKADKNILMEAERLCMWC